MSRYCRDCLRAQVIGERLGEPLCRCALGFWGPESWPVALVIPACNEFLPAAEQPGDLEFWGLVPGYGLEPEPRKRSQSAPPGGRRTQKENGEDGRAEHSQELREAA